MPRLYRKRRSFECFGLYAIYGFDPVDDLRHIRYILNYGLWDHTRNGVNYVGQNVFA